MSMPIKHGGDSNPTMMIKLALPRASPHWISGYWVFPAIESGLSCAPRTGWVNGSKDPHWARYRHQMANPRQVTDAPVSTSPSTGMPSIWSRPEMGGATAHLTGATLAPGDSSVKFSCTGGALGLPFVGGSFIIWSGGDCLICSGVCCRSNCCNSVRAGQR